MKCLQVALPSASNPPKPKPLGKTAAKLLLSLASYLIPAAAISIATPARAAERIYINYGALEFSLPVSSLAKYAKEGVIDSELEVYAGYADGKQLEQLRQALLTKIDLDRIAVAQFLYSPIGEILLNRLGEVIQTRARLSGFYALRSALILAAADPEGLTLLNILQKFPTAGIRLNSSRALEIVDQLSRLIRRTDKAIAAIEQQSETEAQANPANFAQAADLRSPGTIKFSKQTIFLTDFQRQRSFPVDLYLPELNNRQVPLVVISHGLGNDRSTFTYLAKHLAAYGFAVAVPEHPGSNSQQFQAVINGLSNEVVPPREFIDRPLDIKYLLDELSAKFSPKINFNRVGIIGQSFGGYTALALAGASINFAQLQADCAGVNDSLNLSLLLQCRGLELERQKYLLQDYRIQAAIAINPIGSSIYGKLELNKIDIPTAIVTSSADTVAPALAEQIQPFTWLNAPHKYLILMKQGTHFSTLGESDPNTTSVRFPKEAIGPDRNIAFNYMKALSLAFCQTYLANNPEYQPYLSAAYGKFLSQDAIPLSLVQSLSPEQIDGLVNKP